jgi:hypothetical protein
MQESRYGSARGAAGGGILEVIAKSRRKQGVRGSGVQENSVIETHDHHTSA